MCDHNGRRAHRVIQSDIASQGLSNELRNADRPGGRASSNRRPEAAQVDADSITTENTHGDKTPDMRSLSDTARRRLSCSLLSFAILHLDYQVVCDGIVDDSATFSLG
jgi:hypothetical protein